MNTPQNYLSTINNNKLLVWKSKGFLDSLPQNYTIQDIVNSHKTIFNKLKLYYHNKGTLKNNVSLLSKLMRLYNKPEEHKFYKNVIHSLQEEILYEKKEQKQDNNYLTREEIKEKIDYYDKLKYKDLTHNYYHLLLSLYYYNPPLRNDYIDITIYAKNIRKLDNKQLQNKNKNFYVNFKNDGYFIINNDKVSHKLGRATIKINPILNEIIINSLEYRPREFLLTNINNTNKPMYQSAPIEILHRIFNKPVSIKHLRQAYVNHFYNNKNLNENQLEELARQMRHNTNTARTYYKKINKN